MILQEIEIFIVKFIDKNFPMKRKSKYSTSECLRYIYLILKYGFPWRFLQYIGVKCWNTIYKRFVYWVNNNVFKLIFEFLIEQYRKEQLDKNRTIFKNLFIDSSMVKNINGEHKELLGRNHYDRGRFASKISIICDTNKVPFSISFYKANIHDIHTIEDSLKNINNNLVPDYRIKPLLIGDKGYIINNEKKQIIEKIFKRKLITPTRKNQKKKNSKIYSNALKKRYVIEHIFNKLDSYERIRQRRERKIKVFKEFHFFAILFIVFPKIKNLKI